MAAFYSLLCKAIKKQPAGRSGRLFCKRTIKKIFWSFQWTDLNLLQYLLFLALCRLRIEGLTHLESTDKYYLDAFF